jgi:DivIVA domain-containing protein
MSLSQRLHEVAFSEASRGYERAEVDQFVAEITVAVDQLLGRVRTLEGALAQSAGDGVPGETTVARALVLAQRAADIAMAEANDSALATRQQADAEAAKILRDARAEAAAVRDAARSAAEATMIDLEQRRDPLVKGLAALQDRAVKYRDGLREILADQLLATEDWLTATAAGDSSPPPVWPTALGPPPNLHVKSGTEEPTGESPLPTAQPPNANPLTIPPPPPAT